MYIRTVIISFSWPNYEYELFTKLLVALAKTTKERKERKACEKKPSNYVKRQGRGIKRKEGGKEK